MCNFFPKTTKNSKTQWKFRLRETLIIYLAGIGDNFEEIPIKIKNIPVLAEIHEFLSKTKFYSQIAPPERLGIDWSTYEC